MIKNTKLIEEALKAQKNSYSPYSKARIGSAVLSASGKIYLGCNVENASYGGTVCAERTAILKGVSEEGPQFRIKEIAVVNHTDDVWPPCGLCRQVIAEFALPDALVHAGNKDGVGKTQTFAELFPSSFTPDFLIKG